MCVYMYTPQVFQMSHSFVQGGSFVKLASVESEEVKQRFTCWRRGGAP